MNAILLNLELDNPEPHLVVWLQEYDLLNYNLNEKVIDDDESREEEGDLRYDYFDEMSFLLVVVVVRNCSYFY